MCAYCLGSSLVADEIGAARWQHSPMGIGDGMDESTGPTTRQMGLTALTTEHFVLQSARIGTIGEANGRSSLYLGTLSSAAIAIAFIG